MQAEQWRQVHGRDEVYQNVRIGSVIEFLNERGRIGRGQVIGWVRGFSTEYVVIYKPDHQGDYKILIANIIAVLQGGYHVRRTTTSTEASTGGRAAVAS